MNAIHIPQAPQAPQAGADYRAAVIRSAPTRSGFLALFDHAAGPNCEPALLDPNALHVGVVSDADGIVALCGQLGNDDSERDARIFGAAHQMLAVLREALALLTDPDADADDANRVEASIVRVLERTGSAA